MNDALTIAAIDVIPVRLPLREPFVVAYGAFPDVPSVLVRVTTEAGQIGWGEATPDPHVTGETYSGTAETLRRDLAPALIGHDARDRTAALRQLDRRVEGVPAAKAALDIALHDLVARALGIPLWALLGGRSKESLTISRVVSLGDAPAMAESAARHVAAGFATVKIKLGDPEEPRRDIERLAAVREAVGPDIAIKVDVNQGWRTAGTAIATIREMASSQPAYIEQPVTWWDLEGLAEVRRQTGATMMVDEGCHGPRDMQRVVALRAADLVNIKLMKCGGLLPALALNAIAETAGIVAQVGTMVESSIASAAGLHLALALENVRTVEMGGPLMLRTDIGNLGECYERDRIVLPASPGLGIEVDAATVEAMSDAWWNVTADGVKGG